MYPAIFAVNLVTIFCPFFFSIVTSGEKFESVIAYSD